MVKQLTTCCCGCSLRTGTLIIGVLGIFGGMSTIMDGLNVGNSMFYIMPLKGSTTKNTTSSLDSSISNTFENETSISNSTDMDTSFTNISVAQTPDRPIKRKAKPMYVLTYETLTGALRIILGALLVIGTVKDNPKLVYPWIFANAVMCIVSIIVNFILLVAILATSGPVAGFMYIGLLLIFITLYLYVIMVVNSYYNTILLPPEGSSYA